MKYYPALKMKEILPFAATGMELKDIMPCGTCQTLKEKYCMIMLVESKISKLTEGERRMVVASGWD